MIQDIVAIFIACLAAGYVGRKLWRSFSGSGSCHCAQADTAISEGAPSCGRMRTGVKRTPLVPAEQLTLPDQNPAHEA